MQTITTNVLETVSGGASKSSSSEISTALAGIQSGLKDALSSKNNSSSIDPTMMLVLAMTMGNKSSGPTVVQAAPGAAPAAHGPIVNISTRVRRGW